MKSRRYLNVILTLLTLVMALNLVSAWSSAPAILPAAYAQGIPDEGAQRNQIIEQLKQLNRKADELNELLSSGRVSVRVAPQRPQEEK